jgi:hypothetical protein
LKAARLHYPSINISFEQLKEETQTIANQAMKEEAVKKTVNSKQLSLFTVL